MTVEDIYNLIAVSPFIDSAIFTDELKVSKTTISHSQYHRTCCEIKDGVCYATAGCVHDGKSQEGNVNQCINLAKLPSNGQFIIDDIFEYRADAYGRVYYAKASLGSHRIERMEPGEQNNKRAQEKDLKKIDQGGHIIAKCLGGPNEAINIVPQNKKINASISKLESFISSLMNLGWSISLEVKIEYDNMNSFRPAKFHYVAKGSMERDNDINIELNIDNDNE